MKTALYFDTLADKKVRCTLCPHHCLLTDGKRGICLTRQTWGGVLMSLNYCRPVSIAVDPVEKKPLFHFYPGSEILSAGPNGCTFKCSFCQNSEISQHLLSAREIPADKFAQMIISSGTIGIAYTYSEPYIWFETIMEVGALVRDADLHNVMVTNGYMEPEPLADLLKVVDAMNIDIKSMNPKFYKELCKADLAPVLRTCETVKKNAHLEITNLVIPGENDTDEEFNLLADFIANNLGKDTPLHLSRYFPRYNLKTPPTPETTLIRAWEICRQKLDFVYVGNMSAGDMENTYCPLCRSLLIERTGYDVNIKPLFKKAGEGANCGKCGAEILIQG